MGRRHRGGRNKRRGDDDLYEQVHDILVSGLGTVAVETDDFDLAEKTIHVLRKRALQDGEKLQTVNLRDPVKGRVVLVRKAQSPDNFIEEK